MTLQDWGFWAGIIATVIAAGYSALTYHRPRDRLMTEKKTPHDHSWRPARVVAMLVLVAWAGVGFDYYDRHYLSPAPLQAMALSPDNARLEAEQWSPVISDADSQMAVNIHIVNRGRGTATQLQHKGVLMSPPAALTESSAALMLEFLRLQLKYAEPPPTIDIIPGNNNLWFSIPDTKSDSASLYYNFKSNKGAVIYVINVMKYKDEITSKSGKAIYTESCIYLVDMVTHYCEFGHNHAYILPDPQ